MTTIDLPWPPSLNHYYRHVGSRVLISREGRAYRDLVAGLLRAARVKPLVGRLAVEMRVYPPDRRIRDLDNLQKGLLDALQHGGLFADDGHIDRLAIERCGVERGGRINVSVEEWG